MGESDLVSGQRMSVGEVSFSTLRHEQASSSRRLVFSVVMVTDLLSGCVFRKGLNSRHCPSTHVLEHEQGTKWLFMCDIINDVSPHLHIVNTQSGCFT